MLDFIFGPVIMIAGPLQQRPDGLYSLPTAGGKARAAARQDLAGTVVVPLVENHLHAAAVNPA